MSQHDNLSNQAKGMLTIVDLDLESELSTTELKTIVGGRGSAGGGSISAWNSFKSLVFGVDANFYQDESDAAK
jgi:bacteriocin-like protein